MDFNTAVYVYEHFLYIDESLQLSVSDYPDIDAIESNSNNEIEFTYYDFIYKDHLEIRAILSESNITNLDAHYMLKKFIQKFINSKNERSRNQLAKPFDYDAYLLLANEENEEDAHSSYFMEIIVDMIEQPQYLFEFIADFGTYNLNLKYEKYPYKSIENNNMISYVIASYLSHLPFKIYTHKVDYDVTFTSYKEVIEWQNNLYRTLIDNKFLNQFLKLRDLVQTFISKIKTLNEINIDLGFDFHQMKNELSFRESKL